MRIEEKRGSNVLMEAFAFSIHPGEYPNGPMV
jgi:hypothetical protein